MNPTLPLQAYDVRAAACPAREVLDHVTSRWGGLVLIVLQDGTLRFGELRDGVGGVSDKMLSQTLRVLEHDGFVARHAYAEVPPRVEYSLTPLGREVASRLDALTEWIMANMDRVQAARAEHGVKR